MSKRGRPRKNSKKLRVPSFKIEKKLKKKGWQFIAGVDEVGRGAWAGPLYSACVILPDKRIYKIRDSKLLTAEQREHLTEKIKKEAVDFSYGRVETDEMDKIGMHKATLLSFKRALNKLKRLDYILTDRFHVKFLNKPYKNIVNGDQDCLSVAAASIIAKVKRDKIMRKIGKKYREYGFEDNKGYHSSSHKEALNKFGPCRVHRKNFEPIKKLLAGETI